MGLEHLIENSKDYSHGQVNSRVDIDELSLTKGQWVMWIANNPHLASSLAEHEDIKTKKKIVYLVDQILLDRVDTAAGEKHKEELEQVREEIVEEITSS